MNTTELYDPTPLRQAEQAPPDISEIIKDVPPFTMTIKLRGHQGTLMIDSGLDETDIVKSGTTLKDPVAIMKVILAAQDTLNAITPNDVRKMGFRPQKQ